MSLIKFSVAECGLYEKDSQVYNGVFCIIVSFLYVFFDVNINRLKSHSLSSANCFTSQVRLMV